MADAERAQIVMVADAIQFDVLAVEEKALVHREFNGANAKRRFIDIHRLAVLLPPWSRPHSAAAFPGSRFWAI